MGMIKIELFEFKMKKFRTKSLLTKMWSNFFDFLLTLRIHFEQGWVWMDSNRYQSQKSIFENTDRKSKF